MHLKHKLKPAKDTIPHVPSLFWAFRLMVASGFLMLLLFALPAFAVAKRNAENKPWLLKFALFGLPLPWIACANWLVCCRSWPSTLDYW